MGHQISPMLHHYLHTSHIGDYQMKILILGTDRVFEFVALRESKIEISSRYFVCGASSWNSNWDRLGDEIQKFFAGSH